LRLVVFGWGNDARGDDGLGPLLLNRVARAGWPDMTTVEDFQLQIEHALDLDGAEAALFLDAGKNTPAPFAFAEIEPARSATPTTHALAPEAVLDVYARFASRRRHPSRSASAANDSNLAKACRRRRASGSRRRGRSFRA